MRTFTEENYLKIIYHLSLGNSALVQTNAIAERIQTKAASVTDMMRKLSEKKLLNYQKYQGVSLTEQGETVALDIVRKHRLWEVFLVDKLKFKWDQVHEIAEELEHINSGELIERLDEFLKFPTNDPHGDPIPDKDGKFSNLAFIKLNKLEKEQTGIIMGVSEHSPEFLQHLERLSLTLGRQIAVMDIIDFDGSLELEIEGKKINVSREIAKHLLVKI
ncbi:DtxR family Mn-dependent transcriptional regulator [Pedobacter sp. UYP24]